MLERLMFRLLRHMLWGSTQFFFGIDMGPSPQENTQYNALANLSNFATSEGEADVAKADKFWQAILSGDPGQISQVLGPQESALNKQAQESKKTTAEFGNRGGGTNAFMQSTDDRTRAGINDMTSSLTGTAASALGASGSSLLSTGVTGHEGAFSEASTIQQQKAAKMNDLFKSIASVAASFAPGGGAAAAGASAGGGNWWDNVSFPGDSGGTMPSWMGASGEDTEQ